MVETRPATPQDDAFLRQLFDSVRAGEFAALPLPEPQRSALMDMQFRAQRGQYAAAFPEASFDILERDGTPIGNLTVDRSGPALHVIDIGLLSEFRGQGIGSAILRKLLAEAASAGKPVTLQVAASNPAQALYRRLGFRDTGRDAVYIRMEWCQQPQHPSAD